MRCSANQLGWSALCVAPWSRMALSLVSGSRIPTGKDTTQELPRFGGKPPGSD